MLDIVDRAYLITDGKISGITELLSSQMARERYFGNSFNLPKTPTQILQTNWAYWLEISSRFKNIVIGSIMHSDFVKPSPKTNSKPCHYLS